MGRQSIAFPILLFILLQNFNANLAQQTTPKMATTTTNPNLKMIILPGPVPYYSVPWGYTSYSSPYFQLIPSNNQSQMKLPLRNILVKIMATGANSSMTKGELKTALDEGAKSAGDEAQNYWTQLTTTQKGTTDRIREFLNKNLAGELTDLVKQIFQIYDDDSINFMEECSRVRQALFASSFADRPQELQKYFSLSSIPTSIPLFFIPQRCQEMVQKFFYYYSTSTISAVLLRQIDSGSAAWREYVDILGCRECKKGELRQKLLDWSRRNGVENKFRNFTDYMAKSAETIFDTNLLAGPVLEAFRQILAIYTNDALTRVEDCDQTLALLRSLDSDSAQFFVNRNLPEQFPAPPVDTLTTPRPPGGTIPPPPYSYRCEWFRAISPTTIPRTLNIY